MGFRIIKAVRTALRKRSGESNFEKWENLDNFSPDWHARTKALADMIVCHSSVLEFGAGALALRNFLPKDCKYTPSDLVDRGVGTIVCDLNADELPVFPEHDTVVFSGVLEYVNDVPRLIKHIAPICTSMAVSYVTPNSKRNKSLVRRRAHGWVNDYSDRELRDIFSRNEFECVQESMWDNQSLFLFNR